MQKAESQNAHAQNQSAQRQGGVAALESPQGERIAQLEAMAERSPQVGRQAQLAVMVNRNSRMSAQRKAISAIYNSPNLTAQRQQLDSLTGATVQSVETPANPIAPIQLSGREGDELDPGPGQGEQAPPTPRPVQGGRDRPPPPEGESLIQDGYSPRAGEERDETAQLVKAGESSQLKVAQCVDAPVKPNNTGLPDSLKRGIESLSGMAMDNVKVHYNSPQPAQLNALAYAQGADIHVGPGQERHLPHEAWHVVQQAQGRVKPTMQMKEGVPVNDDAGLEAEADIQGARAIALGQDGAMRSESAESEKSANHSSGHTIQRARADVSYTIGNGGQQNVQGEDVGQGGVGGQTHSEQGVWAQVEGTLTTALAQGRSVVITFSVDTTICHLCSPWFENTVWAALNNANNNGTFQLFVEVGGARVEVEGAQTIWPNEIADAPTWDRLGEFERMDRFLTNNRDNEGELQQDALSPHVATLLGDLKSQMGMGLISEADVEQCLATAKTDACRLQVAAYDFRTPQGNEDPVAMEATMAGIELFDVMSSGGLGAIPNFSYAGGLAAGQANWRQTLTLYFQAWLEAWIDENLDDSRIKGEY